MFTSTRVSGLLNVASFCALSNWCNAFQLSSIPRISSTVSIPHFVRTNHLDESIPPAPSVARKDTRLFGLPSEGGVVITGSAGGVGFAYAGEFLDRGYDVVLCDVKDCTTAAKALSQRYNNGNENSGRRTGTVYHTTCDVSSASDVEKLGQFAIQKVGTIQYWINNAGINGGRRELRDVPVSQVELVVKVNLIGILLCTKVAMDIMGQQEGITGHIFNTVGSGVKGGGTPGYACYGATKRGLPQLTASLVKEIDEGIQGYPKKQTPGRIMVHNLSPGMVFTRLLLDDSTPELRKFPFGVLAAQPEEVAADLVPKILTTTTNGSSVEFLTPDKILTKFFERFVLQKKSDYIDDDGNVIKLPGEQYDESGARLLY
jgi:chlorophyll(ide) b reductase